MVELDVPGALYGGRGASGLRLWATRAFVAVVFGPLAWIALSRYTPAPPAFPPGVEASLIALLGVGVYLLSVRASLRPPTRAVWALRAAVVLLAFFGLAGLNERGFFDDWGLSAAYLLILLAVYWAGYRLITAEGAERDGSVYLRGEEMMFLADGREVTRGRRLAAIGLYVLAALWALASNPEAGLVTDPFYSLGLLFAMLIVYWLALRLLSRERDDRD